MHNLYTLRGAKVRDASKWSGYIDEAIDLFGADTEVVFNSHHWPVWGNAQVLDYLKKQRDMYAFIHDQTLHLASGGLTPRQIAETIKLPKSLEDTFADRGYYGTLKHNAKAVYQFYFGWFDGNPANLDPLPPQELGKRYVEAIGGPTKVLAAAQTAYDAGDYRWAATLLDNLVFAEPQDRAAKELLARTLRSARISRRVGSMARLLPYRRARAEAWRGRRQPRARRTTRQRADRVGVRGDGHSDRRRGGGRQTHHGERDVHRSEAFVRARARELGAASQGDATGQRRRRDGALTKDFWLSFLSKQASVKDLVFSDALDIDGDRLALVSLLKLLQPATPGFPIVTPAVAAQ